MSSGAPVDEFERWQTDLDVRLRRIDRAIEEFSPRPAIDEIGTVTRLDAGVAEISGLPGVGSEELVEFPGGRLGMAFDLNPGRLGVILLDEEVGLGAGDVVHRTGRVMSTPVGEALLGRVVDPAGRPLDGGGVISTSERWPIERPAPGIMERAPVGTPLQTGIKAIDALVPIGRGQRELILGDRQTGKTTIAVDTVINQAEEDVVCVYCAVGIRSSAVAKVIRDLEEHGAMEYTTVVVAAGDDPAGRQFIAPYAATSMAEYFMERGRDVLVVYDDLTRHARAYRELSLLLRRPPGREAYPGDIFYIHSRLLERPTNLRNGGTLTALPIIETQAQNMSAYIPTNLISITDGQIYLSPKLFQHGVLPAIDVARSVSRVGGRAQLPAYHAVAGDLRLSYSQFEELERFSRYGARLEREREQKLERGRRVREVLKQDANQPQGVQEQIAILAAVIGGAFDAIPIEQVGTVSRETARELIDRMGESFERVRAGERLTDEELTEIQTEAQSIAHSRV